MDNINFTAIDFETASNFRHSICQIGICRVENGEIIFQKSYHVQPPNNEYSHWNVLIHGIGPETTEDKPTFPEIWQEIKIFIENQLVIAHNSDFDLDCLEKTLDYYNLESPFYRHDCTYKATGLNLVDLAESLEITFQNHHDALADSVVCAKAYVKLMAGIIPDQSKITVKSSKSIFEGHEKLTGKVLKPDLENADSNSLFFNKKLVFTGVLNKISRDEAAQITKKMGADIDTGVTKRTDFVIVGEGAGPSKLKKIHEFNSAGANIKIINEEEFLGIIQHGL
jgi:DNA polymerase III subunit epsilon